MCYCLPMARNFPVRWHWPNGSARTAASTRHCRTWRNVQRCSPRCTIKGPWYSRMAIEIRPARWDSDYAQLSAIRRSVFIEEQAVPEEQEWDSADAEAWHWLALLDGEPAGTARMLRNG